LNFNIQTVLQPSEFFTQGSLQIKARKTFVSQNPSTRDSHRNLDTKFSVVLSLLSLVIFLAAGAYGQSQMEAQQAWRHYQQAQERFQEQNLENARQEVTLALRLLPHMPEAENLLGVIDGASGHPIEAEAHFSQALKIRADYLPAHFNLALICLKLKKVEMAKKELETVLRLDPSHAGAHYYLGLTLRDSNQYRQALMHFKVAHRIEPKNFATLMGVLECQLYLKQQLEVEESFREAERLVDIRDPQSLQLGALLASRGAYPLAIESFKKILDADPESYDANYNLALTFFLANDTKDAEALLKHLLLEHNTAEAHNLLAQVHERNKQFLQSVTEYEQAVTLEPGNEDFRFDYCLMLVQHRALDFGISQLTQATEDFPKSGRIWVALGAANYLSGDSDQALKALFRATEVAPHLGESYYYLGRLYSRVSAEEQKSIMETLKNHLVLEPEDAWAHYFYGVGIFQQQQERGSKNFFEATAHFRKAIELNRHFSEAYFSLGLIDDAQGKTASSIMYFLRAANTDPTMPEAHYRLAIAYSRLGQKEKAEVESERFQKLSTEAADLKDKKRSEFFEIIRNVK
jgi:tetratricopeptide (TPR) repeat protein